MQLVCALLRPSGLDIRQAAVRNMRWQVLKSLGTEKEVGLGNSLLLTRHIELLPVPGVQRLNRPAQPGSMLLHVYLTVLLG